MERTHAMTTERYTTIDGDVVEYPAPSPEVAAFLARAIAAANDPRVTEAQLTELLYGRENPILDQTVFPGRGAVTAAVFGNPLYRVITDLVAQKQRLAGTFVEQLEPARAYTLTVAEAAARIGVTEDAVRKAIAAQRLSAQKRGASYWIDPRDADTYREHVRPRGTARIGAKPGAKIEVRATVGVVPKVQPSRESPSTSLRVRCGGVEGRSLRIKAPGSEVSGKYKGLVDLVVPTFHRVAIATASTKTQHLFVLEPGDTEARIEWGPFHVEGRFRVIEKIEDARASANAWKTFEPS
jgi:excisionase family DNA binding protein